MSNLKLSSALPTRLTMSSREIAELTGKNHKEVMRDCRNMFEALNIQSAQFCADYKDSKGRVYQEYLLDQDLSMTLVMGYSIPLRHKVATRWRELETGTAALPQVPQPKSYLPEYRKAKALDVVTNVAERICNRFPALSQQSQQAVFASLINKIADDEVIPLPAIKKHYTATEAGRVLGVSATRIGKIANAYKLKTTEHGYFRLDKAKYTDKQVETFVYNDTGVSKLRSLLTTH